MYLDSCVIVLYFRETPTSAGPNSFGKFRMGFCDANKMFERKLKEAQEESTDGDKQLNSNWLVTNPVSDSYGPVKIIAGSLK